MRDRQLFEHSQLVNGISVHQYRNDTPYTHVILQVPAGSANNTGGITPGTFHFLEHILMLRSTRHPQEKEFYRLVGLKSGKFSAYTSTFNTTYEIKIPSKHLPAVLPGFFSQVFEPVFNEQDIARERGVIASERRKKERWFPGSSEIGQYMYTKWKWNCTLTLRQRIGFDEDLAMMTPQSLQDAHRHYFDPRTWVMVGGSGDASVLFDMLASLNLSEQQHPQPTMPVRWVQREYHEKFFRDLHRYELRYGGFTAPIPKPLEANALGIILQYLTDHTHGPLYQWLRAEKGWVYEVRASQDCSCKVLDWQLYLPMGSREQVRTVRRELPDRVWAALSDEDAINREVDCLGDYIDAFAYLTLDQVLRNAYCKLDDFGCIITQSQESQYLEKMRDTSFLQQVWRESFAPEQTGCFCTIPQNE